MRMRFSCLVIVGIIATPTVHAQAVDPSPIAGSQVPGASADLGTVSDWYLAGTRLDQAAVAILEKQVDADPNNLEPRFKILGFYFEKRDRDESARAAAQPHILWIIRNIPDSVAAGVPEVQVQRQVDPIRYEEAAKAWKQQVARHPGDPALLGNAAEFFLLSDPQLSERLLHQAQAIEPNDPVWNEKLGHLYSLEAMSYTGSDRSDAARKALAALEAALPASGETRFYQLEGVAKTAFKAGDMAKASAHAGELLKLAPGYAADWNDGNAIYTGNTILGLVALKHGDIASARNYLLAAAKTPGSPQLDSFGPDLTLASEMAAHGEKDSVIAFLGSISKFWDGHDAEIKEWQEDIRQGQPPAFSPLY